MSERQLLGIEEVATRWGVSIFTIRRRIDAGDIRSVNIGSRRMINLQEVLRVEIDGAGASKKRTKRPRVAVLATS